MLVGAFLAVSLSPAVAAERDKRSYHDSRANDEHRWDAHEDKAYRIWEKENRHKHRDFSKLRAEDQEGYWAWRHQHSDALLKIDIR